MGDRNQTRKDNALGTSRALDPTGVLGEPVWVETAENLAIMAADIARQPRVAVDTESNSLHAYREQVCLIQFSTPQSDYLVDPLALPDLTALAPALANPAIEKIFHAAEYDLLCLRRDFGFTCGTLFDTMHASRILGYTAVGLDSLLAEKFKITMDKRHQKANWAARPLTRGQIHYARLDTHYLPALRDLLEIELRNKGRWPLAQEDFRRMCRAETSNRRSSPNVIRKFSGRKDISDRELTILSELGTWREGAAENMNRPPYKIMTDDLLVETARTPPAHKTDLAAIGLSERQIALWGEAVLAAVRRAAGRAPIQRTVIKNRNEAMLARLQKLKNWRKKAGGQLGVESDIILPRPYLLTLAENPPRNRAELAIALQDSPSRLEQYADQILVELGVTL
jgi:ribonuclease D